MLKNYTKEVILKDGTGVTLRPIREGDEPLLYQMFKRLSDDDRWFLNHDVSDYTLIEEWIKKRKQNDVISIVAVLEGQIISNATLIKKYYGAKSHIGKIRISVDPAFRERHLGTWMLLDLINMAMAMGLEILVMRLVEGRDASLMRSVKKLEFFEEAVLKKYVKDREGNPHDLVIMIKHLHQRWDHVESL